MPSFCLAPLLEEQVGYAKSIEGFQREIPDNGTGTEILPLVVDTSRYGGSHSGRSPYLSPLPGKRSMEGGNGLLAPRGLYASGQFLHNPVPAFFRPFPRKRLPEIQPQSSHGRKSRVFCQA